MQRKARPEIPGPEWQALVNLLPEAKSLKPSDRRRVFGLLRRRIWERQTEDAQSLNLFRLDDTASLVGLIRSLQAHTPEAIAARIAEWHLPKIEADLEAANWAFRHQAAAGSLVLDDGLAEFRLVRLNVHAYLLLTLSQDERIGEAFARAFGTPPAVHSRSAAKTSDRVWAGWAWFLGPDPESIRTQAAHLQELWDEGAEMR